MSELAAARVANARNTEALHGMLIRASVPADNNKDVGLLVIDVNGEQRVPVWQLDGEGHPRAGLDRIHRVLQRVRPNPIAATALMLTSRPDLDGGTIADMVDDDLDTAIHLIRLAGDQS